MRNLSAPAVLAIFALHQMLRKNQPVSMAEISQSSGSPLPEVESVMRKLRQAGLIQGLPGEGFVPVRAAGEVNILDIVRAVDEAQSPTAPCGGNYDACTSRASCILAPLCQSAEHAYQEALKSFTLEDLREIPSDLPNCADPRIETAVSSAQGGAKSTRHGSDKKR